MNLTVKPLPATPGNFIPIIDKDSGNLFVHPDVYKALKHHKLRENALELLSFAEGFPTALSETLGWTREEVLTAALALRIMLFSVMPELLGPAPTVPGLGARQPPGWEVPEKPKRTMSAGDDRKARVHLIAELQAKIDTAIMDHATLVESETELADLIQPYKDEIARLQRGGPLDPI